MGIELVRIDDRLIHGQVVEGWVPSLNIERILVVSDTAHGDSTQCALMRLCVPDNVALEIVSVAEAEEAIGRLSGQSDKTMVLAAGPRDILALLEKGAGFKTVNVGGLHYAAGTVQLGKAIFLSKEDIDALEAIAKRGVTLEGRAVPSDPSTDLLELIRARS